MVKPIFHCPVVREVRRRAASVSPCRPLWNLKLDVLECDGRVLLGVSDLRKQVAIRSLESIFDNQLGLKDRRLILEPNMLFPCIFACEHQILNGVGPFESRRVGKNQRKLAILRRGQLVRELGAVESDIVSLRFLAVQRHLASLQEAGVTAEFCQRFHIVFVS